MYNKYYSLVVSYHYGTAVTIQVLYSIDEKSNKGFTAHVLLAWNTTLNRLPFLFIISYQAYHHTRSVLFCSTRLRSLYSATVLQLQCYSIVSFCVSFFFCNFCSDYLYRIVIIYLNNFLYSHTTILFIFLYNKFL